MIAPRLPRPRLIDGKIDDADGAALIDWMAWWRPLRATVREVLNFRHPWDISPRWDAVARRWEIRVKPGWVAGQEVEAVSSEWTLEDLPTATLARQVPGETGRPWLSEEPWIPVPSRLFRPVGLGAPGAEPEPVPPYFLARGVLPAETDATVSTPFGLTTQQGGVLEQRGSARRLLACDVLVEQPRPRLETVVAESGELVVSIASPSGVDARPRLVLRRANSDPEPVGSTLQEMLAARVIDEGVDRLRIGTFYLMSQPGETRAEPDETWEPVPQNRVFWNLNHAVTSEVEDLPPLRLPFREGGFLAAGLAGAVIDAQLSALAAADAGAAAFLSTGRIVGRFWTV